jgi:hypothetical protein
MGASEAQQRFEQLAAGFLADPEIAEGTGFGSAPGLRIKGKIFAMLVKDHLVVKLPKERVDELVSTGAGTQFDPGHGRLMKEWASVAPDSPEDWERLAGEALKFVGSR